MFINTIIHYVGIATCLGFLYKITHFALLHFRRPAFCLDRYKHVPEQWGLVTGASDGIGYGYAQELIQRGFKVILLARNRTKLEGCQSRLKREFPGAETKILVVDAISSSVSDLEKAISAIKGLNISILINNIGGVPLSEPPFFKVLSAYTSREIDDSIAINLQFLARFTALVLPLMSRTRPGLILNISSLADTGIPWLVMYSAAKGFVNKFSRALARECRAEKLPIDVLVVTPGTVQSNSQPIPVTVTVPTSRGFARDTLDKVDWAVLTGTLELKPHKVQDLLIGFFEWLPEGVKWRVLTAEINKKKDMFTSEAGLEKLRDKIAKVDKEK